MRSAPVKLTHPQMSESLLLGALLAMAGGFLDAHTYLLRGNVFANAQTGNIVLFGVNLARGDLAQALYCAVPIAAFALGVVATELVRHRFRARRHHLHWRQLIVAAEGALLLGVAFLPVGGEWDVLANVAISFICALQTETFRKVNGSACATTMCTGNLRSATERLLRFARGGDARDRSESRLYYGVIACFIAGATLGALLSERFQARGLLACCALFGAAFLAMFFRGETAPRSRADGAGAAPRGEVA